MGFFPYRGSAPATAKESQGDPWGMDRRSDDQGRVILHVDMDAFFASVEQLFNPHLRGKPVLICGDPEGRSVVATASYEACPFGIRCGMPVGEARRLCPHATLIEGDPGKYIHISLKVLELLQSVSPLVEPFSIDEAFVEVTGQVRTRPEILALASRLQQRIQKTVGVTASIGMGPNKFVAKMASGVHKPEGLTCFSQQDFVRHFGPGPVGEIWGVGKATADSLELLGIRTVNDLARASRELLSQTYGVVGPSLQRVAAGLDESPVVPCHLAPDAKSIGHEHTLDQDESDPEILSGHMLRLSDMVGRRARQDGFSGTVVSLKLRSSNFDTLQAQQSLCHPCSDGLEIHRVAGALYTRLRQGGIQEKHRGRARRGPGGRGALDKIRLIGISLGGLVREEQDLQQRLFAEDQRYHDMISSVDLVRERWGDRVLMRAGTLLTRN